MFRCEIGLGVGFDKDQKPVQDVPKKVDAILTNACRLFGGAALMPCKGGWINGLGKLIAEPGYVLRIDNVKDVSAVREFALSVKVLLNQESVLFTAMETSCEFI